MINIEEESIYASVCTTCMPLVESQVIFGIWSKRSQNMVSFRLLCTLFLIGVGCTLCFHQEQPTTSFKRAVPKVSSTTCRVTSLFMTTTFDDEGGVSDDNSADNGGYDQMIEKDGPKDQLLTALATKDGIFGDKSSRISTLAQDLAGYAMPLMSPKEYQLLYTDAPDLLGFQGGPLSQLVSIKQKLINTNEMEIVLEYKPSDGIATIAGSFLPDIQDDRLQQTITMEYDKQPMNKIDTKIKGTKIEGTRFGNNLPPLNSPTALPFGSFKVLFHDGDLCIQQTTQGEFISIYQRI